MSTQLLSCEGVAEFRMVESPMITVTVKLPEEVFSALRRSPEEFVCGMRLAAAIYWYARGEISQEKAALIAGMDRTDFLLALAREQVDAFVVDIEDLTREYELTKSPSQSSGPM